jgi:hypothetical protein
MLPNLDRAALAACGAYAMWAEATLAIQKYGTIVYKVLTDLEIGTFGVANGNNVFVESLFPCTTLLHHK